jgi:hypothetical protein
MLHSVGPKTMQENEKEITSFGRQLYWLPFVPLVAAYFGDTKWVFFCLIGATAGVGYCSTLFVSGSAARIF